MLGKRKKIHKEDVPLLKKQWEMEFAEEEIKLEKENLDDLKVIPLEDSEPEKIENKQYSEDEHQDNLKQEKENNLQNSNEKKKKRYEWMDSSDDLNNEKSSSLSDSESESEKKQESKKINVVESKANESVLEDRDSRTVFANNLPFDMSSKDINIFFKKYGTIINIDIPKNEGAILNKGRAFIEYQTINEATKALEANNNWIKGRQIQCKLGLINATSHAIEEKKNNPKNQKIIQKYDKKNKNKKSESENEISDSNSESDSESQFDSELGSRSRSVSKEKKSSIKRQRKK